MLTRDKLNDAEWRAIRNTPHHVIVAVSLTGGSAFDDMLERNAGLQAVVDGMHSTHPLMRAIAESTQIMAAQDEIRAWYLKVPDADRTPTTLAAKALESMKQAVAALDAHGTHDDLLQYGDFVVATATRVARAAKEGDLFGAGGQLVSDREKNFIAQLGALARLPAG